jgi:DNA-binding transcriptional regulator GbsR (MarR family)
MCKFSNDSEEGLITHYNDTHDDLVQLGLRLLKSKETREIEKKKKLKQKANKIYLNTEQEENDKKDDTESSFSEVSSDQNIEDLQDTL